MKFFCDKIDKKFYLIILFFINIVWFSSLGNYHVLWGDNFVSWYDINNINSFFDLFFKSFDQRYRPVTMLGNYILNIFFYNNFQLYFFFNIFFNFIIIYYLFNLFCKITKNKIISFLLSLVFITSRFSYFYILQIHGILESFNILLLIIITCYFFKFLKTFKIKNVYIMIFFSSIMCFVHERYIIINFLIIFLTIFFNFFKIYIIEIKKRIYIFIFSKNSFFKRNWHRH
jgi:hypothetical protein